MGVLKSIGKAIGLAGVPEPAAAVDRVAQLEQAHSAAQEKVEALRGEVEAAYVALEEGAPAAASEIQKAEAELAEGERIEARIGAALAAARRVRTERERKERDAAERKAWQRVGKLHAERLATARELAGAIQNAGELYKRLLESGGETYRAMPRKPYAIDGLLLSEMDCHTATGIELAKAGLPSSLRLSPSVLLGMPGLLAKVEDAAQLAATVNAASLDAEDEQRRAFRDATDYDAALKRERERARAEA